MGIHQERNKEMKYDGMPVRAVISMLINVCIVSYMITNYCCADIIRLYVSCNIIHCNISTPLYFVLCAIVKRPIVDFRIFQFSKLGWEQISIINNDQKQFSINQIRWNHLQINTGTCKFVCCLPQKLPQYHLPLFNHISRLLHILTLLLQAF